jgi:hypothetical protein
VSSLERGAVIGRHAIRPHADEQEVAGLVSGTHQPNAVGGSVAEATRELRLTWTGFRAATAAGSPAGASLTTVSVSG